MKTTTELSASEESALHIFPQHCKPSSPKNIPNKISLLYPIVIGFFLITTIIFIVLYAIERKTTKCDQTTPVIPINSKDLCLTRYCINAANNLLESIDERVDPCENFYQFACGTWIKNTKMQSAVDEQDVIGKMETEMTDAIADLLSSLPPNTTVESKAIINARRLYTACVNEDAVETEDIDGILSLINTEFGGWPILLGSTWNESTFNFSQLLFKLSQYNNFVFYYIETKINRKNTSTYLIRIDPSHLNLGYRSFYTEQSQVAKIYREFIRDLVLALTNNISKIDADVNAIVNLEKEIAKHHRISDGQSIGRNIRTTIKNLSKTTNANFDFTSYLRRLYLLGNITLPDDEIVIINDIEAIRNISSIISQQSSRILQNYMIWRFVIHRVPNMPKRFRVILDRLTNDVLGIHNEQSRAITCANYVNNNMGFAVSKLYINKYYDKFARAEFIEIVDNIRNTFIDMINQSMWMDTVSKKRTIEKAQAIMGKVGYPDYLDSDNMTTLETIYADYNFNSSHMQNILNLLQLNAKQNFIKLREPVTRQEWIDFAPTTMNAFYHSLFNKIVIPAGILRPPYFHKDAPKYLNYGAIGSVVGHEITHGFDEDRRHIDKDGKRYTSWSNESINMFDKRSQCVIEQYNNYTVIQVNRQVNGTRTREENIADNDGLKKAFYAYQKWIQTQKNIEKKLPGLTKYSREQMFFISFGQVWCSKMTDKYAKDKISHDNHSPSEFRVNGPTSNLVEFDRVFGCKPGQGNSRVNKCSVW